jgi:formate/nitrite transporter
MMQAMDEKSDGEQTQRELNLDPLLPPAMAARAEAAGVAKISASTVNTFVLAVLAVLAGAFISLGAEFSTVVTTNAGLGYGPTRLLAGVAFSLGLFLVVVAGAELFTGNNLIVMAWAGGKVTAMQVARMWGIVYAGNLAGALGTVALVYVSGQWRFDANGVGGNALRIANAKVNLGFEEAVALGILCNVLVCLAVWLCYSARSNTDKALAVLFPITAFVASGFEHSIANIYFVPLGLLLKDKAAAVDASGLASGDLGNLTAVDFLLRNLLPVTIGNVIGGALLGGAVYWFVYLRPSPRRPSP